MTNRERRELLLALYKPSTGTGNFMPDVANRGGNRIVAAALVKLGLATDDEVQREFRRLDNEYEERSQAAIDRANARDRR